MKAHGPALLLLVGVTLLLLAAARPVLILTAPSEHGTVVLLMDVSLSMAASDVPPTRLAAAKEAALAFVRAQPRGVRIAVVAFGGHADVVQPPTRKREDVVAALESLELQRFTALGNGLMAGLLTLVPTARVPHGYDIFGAGQPPPTLYDNPIEDGRSAARRPKHAPGSFLSAAIILVSDGKGTMGVPPLQAAELIADYGIRVHTVGVGTLYGGVANVDGWPPIHAEFAEELLQQISAVTRGEYFLARNAGKVKTIYEKLGRRVVLERREHELTAGLAAVGAILSLASVALSLLGPLAPGWPRKTPPRTS